VIDVQPMISIKCKTVKKELKIVLKFVNP